MTSSPSGIQCGSDCSEAFAEGTTVTLAATPSAGSTLVGWSGGGCSGTGNCTLTITASMNVQPLFALTNSVVVSFAGNGTGTVTASPGINCPGDCSEAYAPGAMVTLTAMPLPESVFMGWSGGGCEGTDSCVLTISSAVSVVANFALQRYDLTVAKSGNGAGDVTSTPAGIACGATCTASYDSGSMVTLVAAASAGSTFTGWVGGGCSGTGNCSVTMTAARAVSASFTRNQFTLTVVKAGNGAGTVTSSPSGISCGPTCASNYDFGDGVTLTAAASADSTFAGWSGGGCNGTATCVVTIAAATTVTATFTLVQRTLTVSKAGSGNGVVTSSPAGINCGTDCSEPFNHGTTVVLTASPASDSTFAGWSGGGCSNTGPCSVTLTAATAVTATFTVVQRTLTVSKAGSGNGVVTSSPAGINCGTDCSEPYSQGATIVLSASPASGSTFAGWSGGGCSNTGPCSVTLTAATTVTATFTLIQHTLALNKAGSGNGVVTSSPAGINCGTDCSEPYDHGTTIVLSASPASGSTFAGWSGGGCSNTDPCSVTLTAATTVTATFTLIQHTLTVNKAGSGNGAVTSSPAGINCGTDCSEPYDHGTTVVLTASPASGSTFTGWSGACSGTGACSVTLTAAATATATFTLLQHTLTVSNVGSGNGVVTSSPAGINCGTDCSESYSHGTTVVLSASPASGSTFAGWSGGGCSNTDPCSVTLTAATTVTATFTLVQHTLAVNMAGSGDGVVTSSPVGISCGADCSESYNNGTNVILTASPASDSTFAGWSGGGCNGTATCSVTLTAATSVTATFTLIQHTLTVSKAGSGNCVVTSSPPGISCGTDCSEPYNNGTAVILTVTPATGSIFTGWSGGGCGGTGTCAVTLAAATSVTATCTLARHLLTVQKTGDGVGTVTSRPAGISCGTDCSESYDNGTSVVLIATPTGTTIEPSTFAGWSGVGCSGTGSCSMAIAAPTTVTARFTLNLFCDTNNSVSCTNGSLPQIDLGLISSTACRTQCESAMGVAGMTSGCWSLDTNNRCVCRNGGLIQGGTRPGGICSLR